MMKTYYDMFVSRGMMSKLSSIAFGHLLFFSSIYLFDDEFKFIKWIANAAGLSFYVTYWVIPLLLGCSVVVGNIAVIKKLSVDCVLVESDFARSMQYLNRKRKTKDLVSGKVIYQSYPKLLIIAFFAMVLLSTYVAIDNVFVIPLSELRSYELGRSEITKLDVSYFFGLGVMGYIPIYAFIFIRMLFRHLSSCI